MGNQLAAVTTVNVADVSPSLQVVAPLGSEHRSYFYSFHCAKLMQRGDNVLESSRSLSKLADSTDVVVKVFVRTLGNNAQQQQLLEFCHNHLLDISERMTFAKKAPNVTSMDSNIVKKVSNTEDNIDDIGCCEQSTVLPCNVLFYSAMEIHNDRFCMLERSYVAYSLAERLATRPYWNMVQRLFAAYQILQGLVQLHETWRTVHGDLKTDNVLVNTSGWLYLTDICPFKPAFLPANNPALFDYHYDTSETRVCFLAPEKFVDQALSLNISNVNAIAHTQAMDIFSAACVLAHIFTEEPLFCLSEVLALRLLQTQQEREAMVNKLLMKRGVPVCVRRMLLCMLCNTPETRPTARQLLEDFTPSVFPPYFNFIYSDVLPPLLERLPDPQVQLLCLRLEDIFDEVERRCNATDNSMDIETISKDAKQAGALLLLPVIVNASLHLVTADAFCRLILIIQKSLPYYPVEVQTDTILPYLLHYVKMEKYPVVARILALRTLSVICHSATFSPSEATIFEDLVLPCIEDLLNANVTHVAVMVEVADQLPGLLLAARAFLERRQALISANKSQNSFGRQLSHLLDRGWNALQLLYKRNNTTVVATTLRRTMDVVAFLGEERTQEELIPFLTTAITSTVDVQRELYPQAIMCHLYLHTPETKTLHLFVEEGLCQTDVTCLKRTIDSISAIVEKKIFAVWDIMPLVHKALPYILSSNKWVSSATCRLVEKVACTHRVSDVWMYLVCALRPLLRHQVPLASLASFSTAVKLELSFHSPVMEQWMESINSSGTIVGGDADSREAVLSDNMNHKLYYAASYGMTRCNVQGLVSHVASVDVSFDSSMLEPGTFLTDETDKLVEVNQPSAPWRLFFRPTPRERKRLTLRQKKHLLNGNSSVQVANVAEEPKRANNLYFTRRRRNMIGVVDLAGPLIASCSGDEKELRPIAAPWFTQAAHLGGIYCSTAAKGGTLVTAGSRGEAMLWSLGTEGMDYSHRLQTNAPPTSTFLFANFQQEGPNLLLCLGGTDGEWRMLNIACNTVVSQRVFDGSALTAACTLGDFVTLVSSALGGVFAIDHRTGKDVWHTELPPALGAPSGLLPLFYGSQAYGVSVVTLGGGVALFDLRFQMLVQEYQLNSSDINNSLRGGQRASRVMDNPSAVLCVCPNVACKSPEESRHPGLLLGTQAGTVHSMDLSNGKTHVALQPATLGEATRALLVQEKHSVVMTAGNDMWIRKWCMATPAESRTLVCPPYVSPVYTGTVYGGIAETQSEGRNVGVRSVSSYQQGSMDMRSICGDIVPRHHVDAILTLCSVSNGPEVYLASGSRDGTLTLWLNGE